MNPARPQWVRDKRKKYRPKVDEDRRARERAEAAYRAAQGAVWRVVTLEPCGLPPTRLS